MRSPWPLDRFLGRFAYFAVLLVAGWMDGSCAVIRANCDLISAWIAACFLYGCLYCSCTTHAGCTVFKVGLLFLFLSKAHLYPRTESESKVYIYSRYIFKQVLFLYSRPISVQSYMYLHSRPIKCLHLFSGHTYFWVLKITLCPRSTTIQVYWYTRLSSIQSLNTNVFVAYFYPRLTYLYLRLNLRCYIYIWGLLLSKAYDCS